MSIPIARTTDIAVGVCFAHLTPIAVIGTIITGSSNVMVNNLPAARMTDIVLFSCGHVGFIVSGSGASTASSLPIARIGDSVIGTMVAVIVNGSGNCKTT